MTKKEIAYSMIQSGASTDEIAEKTGISKVYVREIRRNLIPKITISDYEDKIFSMREDGKTYEEIGREIGYSASTIKNFLQKVRQERKIIENAECEKISHTLHVNRREVTGFLIRESGIFAKMSFIFRGER